MWFLIIFGFLAVRQASGVIYRLSPSEYDKFPLLTDIDEYEPCMRGPGDVYCFVSAQLYGNKSDPLYNTLVEYSEDTIKHFDHTHLHRGVCPKRSCQHHMNSSSDLTEVIEACLNETLTKDYRLTSKVYKIQCEEYHEKTRFDAADYAFGAVLLTLVGLSFLGSIYDFCCSQKKDNNAGKYLLSFSVRENWRRLAAPPSSEPYQRRLRVIFALKTIAAFDVMAGHVGIPAFFMTKNVIFFEKAYDSWVFVFLLNGPFFVQIFFLTSALLLAYNKLKGERKKPTSWQHLPKNVLDRWLRLIPPYAFLMFYVMTWARHSGGGPFYEKSLQSESDSCWQNWWRHLLLIDNYKDNSKCMIHGWYIAADFQLSILGLMLFGLLSSNRARKLVIFAGVIVGLITRAVHVCFQNLSPLLVVTPELIINFFVHDPTFNNLYKRGHTNIVCYALGLALGYVLFNLKESDIGAEKYKKYRLLYWLTLPLLGLVMGSGMVFYMDGIVVPMGVRMVYSGVIKLLFGLVVSLMVFFTVLMVDRSLGSFFNWAGWARLSRLTYLAYLIHVPLLRLGAANTGLMIHSSVFWHVHNYIGILTMSFLLAVPLYILVEAPLGECTRLVMKPAEGPPKTKPTLADSEDIVEAKL